MIKNIAVAAVALVLLKMAAGTTMNLQGSAQKYRCGCCGVDTVENGRGRNKVTRKCGHKTFPVAAMACLLRTSDIP